jgi:hypothetical protein
MCFINAGEFVAARWIRMPYQEKMKYYRDAPIPPSVSPSSQHPNLLKQPPPSPSTQQQKRTPRASDRNTKQRPTDASSQDPPKSNKKPQKQQKVKK